MGRGLEVKLSDLIGVEAYAQLFNGQKWRIEKWKAFRYTTFLVDGRSEKVEFAKSKTQDIYPEIKLLFDLKGRVVGQRLNHNCRLLTTTEISWLTLPKHNKNKKTIYHMIDSLEEKAFINEINRYIRKK
ncbi:hypothetical protein ACS4H7_002877 [Enterococcus hirae]|nr:hypothetical protein [Enterococcus hirae]EMF0618078.1 hypothetical protein [Enterococcus hirae]